MVAAVPSRVHLVLCGRGSSGGCCPAVPLEESLPTGAFMLCKRIENILVLSLCFFFSFVWLVFVCWFLVF